MLVEKIAFAKINLTLEVGDKRADGYHSLTSVMARISLHNRVEVEKNGVGEIRLFSTDKSIENDDNLSVRAVKGYFEVSGVTFEGVDIRLEKHIPLAAGLGGGSADAAAVIECMEELFGTLEEEKRHDLARGLGADVPYCLEKTPCLCRGIGDECESLSATDMGLFLVIEKEGEKLSTGAVYSALDRLGKRKELFDHNGMVKALETGDKRLFVKALSNDFERVVDVTSVKERMLSHGAIATLMSGAGPTVVGFFDDEEKARVYSKEVYRIV